MTGQQPDSKNWVDDAEDALRRVGDALKAAWEGTRESRVSTLEAAKEAAGRLSNAIDEGVSAARASWEGEQTGTTTSEPSGVVDNTGEPAGQGAQS